MREIADALAALHFETPWSAERSKLWWQKNYTPEAPDASSKIDVTG